jgi:uncharacterized small protein (TIGR04563 family)
VPDYIHLIRIDWHIRETPVELHAAISAANDRCTGEDHTYQTVHEQLAAAAAANPALVADALVETGPCSFAFMFARHGEVTEEDVVEVPEGTTEKIRLPYDDDPPFDLSLQYDSEEHLREHLEAVRPDEAASFVTNVGDDRFLVELSPETWSITKLVVSNRPALFARLMAGDFEAPKPAGRDPAQRYGQPLFFPRAMLDFLQTHATRMDRSLSWVVQYAVKVGDLGALDYGKAAAARADAKLSSGDKQQQTLYFTGYQLDLMEQHAARLDVAVSTIAQTAIAVAKREIEQMPDR